MRRIVWMLPVLFLVAATSQSFAESFVLYNSLPDPQPPNLPSLGYEATSTRQFGELIQFAGSGSFDVSSTVLMSNWALESTYEAVGTSAGYNVPLTLNLYSVGAGNTVGSLLATDTTNAFIAWRPEADPGACGAGSTAYQGADGNCYNGSLSAATFSFGTLNLPSQIIYGLSFNTADYGNPPIGTPGPYNSLNFALSGAPSVGSNPLPDSAYWDTTACGFYADSGASGCGTFRQDTAWTPYNGAVQFVGTTAVPEPASLLLLASGLLAGGFAFRRRVERKLD